MPWYVFRSLSSFHVPTSALHSPICSTERYSHSSVYRDINTGGEPGDPGGNTQLHASTPALCSSICVLGMAAGSVKRGRYNGERLCSRKGAVSGNGRRQKGESRPIQGWLHGSRQRGCHIGRRSYEEGGNGERVYGQLCSALHGRLCSGHRGLSLYEKTLKPSFIPHHHRDSSLTGLKTCSLMPDPALTTSSSLTGFTTCSFMSAPAL